MPERVALYFAPAGDGTVLYIGAASVSLRQRWANHHRQDELAHHAGCRIAWLYVEDTSLLYARGDHAPVGQDQGGRVRGAGHGGPARPAAPELVSAASVA